jgi:hypothetical protein
VRGELTQVIIVLEFWVISTNCYYLVISLPLLFSKPPEEKIKTLKGISAEKEFPNYL